MTTDLDRDIVTIRYNLLNLPDTIQFKNGRQIINRYDATGQKLSTMYVTPIYPLSAPLTAGATISTDNSSFRRYGTLYNANVEYTLAYNGNRTLARIHNAEGYALPSNILFYHRKDHLGSIRSLWSTNYNYDDRYYPSGLPWDNNTGYDVGTYKYNGKEFIETHGLDEYDSQARWYYPAIMRTTTMDPHAENYYNISPYAWCGNNPVNRVDPDGRDIWEINDIGEIIKRIKDKTQDAFYIVDNKGNRTYTTDADGNNHYNSISFEYGTITDSQKAGWFRGDATSFSVVNESSGAELFKFFADNTKIEFGLINTQNNGSIVMTNHKGSSVAVSMTAQELSNKGQTVTSIVHNHPNNSQPSGFGTGDKSGDKFAASNYLPNVNRYVYHPRNSALIQYDNKSIYGTTSWMLVFPSSEERMPVVPVRRYPGIGLPPP